MMNRELKDHCTKKAHSLTSFYLNAYCRYSLPILTATGVYGRPLTVDVHCWKPTVESMMLTADIYW